MTIQHIPNPSAEPPFSASMIWHEYGDIRVKYFTPEEIYIDPVKEEGWSAVNVPDYGAVVTVSNPLIVSVHEWKWDRPMLTIEDDTGDDYWDFQLLSMYESLRSHFHAKNLR